MSELRRLLCRCRALFRRDDDEAARELASHLQMLEDEWLRRGCEPDEARRRARISLGGALQTAEQRRDARTLPWIEDGIADLRHAGRGMRRAPGFAITVMLTLALGIGLNVAVFAVVRAVLLRPLPYPNPDRIVRILEEVRRTGPEVSNRPALITRTELDALRSGVPQLEGLGAYDVATVTLSGIPGTPASRATAVRITPTTLRTLGVRPAAGRLFEPQEEMSGIDRLAVLSHRLRTRLFGTSPDVIHRELMLNGAPYRVVGVMPESFHFPDQEAELWLPYVWRDAGAVMLTGRLRPAASIDDANEALTRVLRIERMDRWARMVALGIPLPPPPPTRPDGTSTIDPEMMPTKASVTEQMQKDRARSRFLMLPLQEQWVSPVRPALITLTVVVTAVLMLACVNAVGLLTARASSRQHETALRLALGARRGRLLRQSLVESTALALAGGTAGVILAWIATSWFRSIAAGGPRMGPSFAMPPLGGVTMDAGVMLFTLAVSVVIGLICGVMGGSRPAQALKSTRPRRWHALLIGVEVAVATMLVISGGLLVRSFAMLSNVQPGFDADRIATFQLALPAGRATLQTYDEVVARVSRVPGVAAVGFADQLPVGFGRLAAELRVTPPDLSAPPPPPPPPGPVRPADAPDIRVVSQTFLRALGARVIDGRGFAAGDTADATPVMLINKTLAQSGLLGHQPVGRFVYLGSTRPWLVAGVVSDVRQSGLDQAAGPQVFLDYRQAGRFVEITESTTPHLIVRATGDPSALVSPVQNALRAFEPLASVERFATLSQVLSRSMAPRWFYTVLALALALTAVVLALAGVHGIVAFVVSQRTQEIGVHVALGATRAQVLMLVMRHVMIFGAIGTCVGVAGALLVTRLLDGLLFGLSSIDPVTFAVAPVLFMLTTAIAAALPARRALSVDPLVALRRDR
ncbi:MAG: ABC transporter permease [Gemmatimonadaceae bacterium]|nr:ABC transporter permease [Gemmatimonadaceae bacterium]